MGKSGSNNLFGSKNQLYISTKKPNYTAGEVVEGSVFLNIVSPMHVDAVYLKTKGYQFVCFEKKIPVMMDSGKKELVKKEFSSTDILYKKKTKLLSVKKVMPVGVYEFPFTFTLDSHLPSTFTLSGQCGGCDFCGKVLYKVKGEVTVPGLFKANIKQTQQFVVNEPGSQPLTDYMSFRETSSVFLCCIPLGKTSIFASVDKSQYEPGDVVSVRLVVDNSKSSVSLPPASLRIIQNIEFTSSPETSSQTVICGKTHGHSVNKGIRDERFVSIPLSMNLQSSTNGNLVKCKYSLEITQMVPNASNLVVLHDIQVCLSHLPEYKALAIPSEWNPSTYPATDADIHFQAY